MKPTRWWPPWPHIFSAVDREGKPLFSETSFYEYIQILGFEMGDLPDAFWKRAEEEE